MTNENVTYEKFIITVPEVARHYEWRYGQALFNLLAKVRPHLAWKIRGGQLDPFYRDLDGIPLELWTLLQAEWDLEYAG